RRIRVAVRTGEVIRDDGQHISCNGQSAINITDEVVVGCLAGAADGISPDHAAYGGRGSANEITAQNARVFAIDKTGVMHGEIRIGLAIGPALVVHSASQRGGVNGERPIVDGN